MEVIDIPTRRPKRGEKRGFFSTISGMAMVESSCPGRRRNCAPPETPPSGAQMGRPKCARTFGSMSARYAKSRPDNAHRVYSRSRLGNPGSLRAHFRKGARSFGRRSRQGIHHTVHFGRDAINAFGETFPHSAVAVATSTSAKRCFGAFAAWGHPGNSGRPKISNSGRENFPR